MMNFDRDHQAWAKAFLSIETACGSDSSGLRATILLEGRHQADKSLPHSDHGSLPGFED